MYLINKSSFDDDMKKKPILKDPIIPQIYGKIKMNKKGIPMRLIFNTNSPPTY